MGAMPNVASRVTLIARMLRTRFDTRSRSIGLTRAQWRTIATVAVDEGATQSQIASRLDINSVTAGRILDRLETVGCIARRPDSIDRRVNRIFLTDAASPLLDRLSVLGQEEERILLGGFTKEEQQQLGDYLQRVIDNMQASPVPETPAGADEIELA